jgi:hypothetical protein
MRSVFVSSRLAGWLAGLLIGAGLSLLLAGPVSAAAPVAAWSLHAQALPTGGPSVADNTGCLESLGGQGEGCDAYEVVARDAGSAAMDGSTVTLTDTLPAGVTVQRVVFRWSELGLDLAIFGFCPSTTAPVVRCQLSTEELGLPPVAPDDTLRMYVYVTVNPGVQGSLPNGLTVSGGGAPEATVTEQSGGSSTPVLFGVTDLVSAISGVDGAPDTQAGGHPYEYTTRIDLNNVIRLGATSGTGATSVRDLRDAAVDLPLGFVGSELATPTCTLAQLTSGAAGGATKQATCPADTQVGYIRTEHDVSDGTGVHSPLYNIVPEHGVAAELGYFDGLHGAHVLYTSVLPTPQGYVLRATSPEIPQVVLTGIEVTLYGDPAARQEELARREGQSISTNTPVAFFTNPARCGGEPLVSGLHIDSWGNPGRFNTDGTPDLTDPAWASATSGAPAVTGCNLLRFEPSLTVAPETTGADTPTGLEVDLKVPQDENPGTVSTPPLRNASVTLPAGLTLNPAAATGLGACTEAQIALASVAPPTCPESSKIGSVEVSTPALAGTLVGSVYLATQNENPFHALLAGYIVIDDPTTGVVVKIPGSLTPDPSTGQITGVFNDNPQFPVGELKLHFFGGARGELATPTGCGTYTTTSDLMPWSAPDSGPDATPSSSFPINTGCANAFTPSLTAGTQNPQAGGYSPFTLSLSRNDGEQDLAGIAVTLPPGLLGKIAGIPLCPDANANAGTCPESSLVGSVQAGAGVGPNPLFVGGKAYLTGPYNGGPYGLVVEVPAVAGPFNLGMIVVRQSLRIDPHTAQVTDVSDPFPTIIDGIPLRVRRVDVTLDRPGFTFNPTSCTPMAINGRVISTRGASANVSSRFQAAGCRELPFKPSFTVSTQANTSKKNGASLDVKLGYPKGSQANIRSVGVTLPKALPSRLTTIQQACPEATFNQNPASCPAGSNIGIATAHTPVLAGPVVGPAYLVSHGGAAFPDLVLILQGEGVKLELTGSINIKKSVTSSAFDAVPDAPISSFELKLPEGPHSGLAAVLPAKAKGNLCGTRLTMPTTLTGQNGAQIKQNTKIAVTGCPKAKKARHKKAKGRKGSKRKGRG